MSESQTSETETEQEQVTPQALEAETTQIPSEVEAPAETPKPLEPQTLEAPAFCFNRHPPQKNGLAGTV